ncbi:hypothetical protein CFO_g5087 [Ceratocystis platani]|uniref:Protein kinase domain-containing protein n=1 Tax=Ceratocystis fimbriata f. sp. platani TaxID=88771 RepID=A0A0F8BJV7_CERFI|nr:hypothetical protein CFO_g5087 [Ceratocystis platani]
MFEAETTVYNSLQDIQGKLVPHLLASINLDILPPNNNVGNIDAFEPFCIKGILLQYIQGFSLSKVQDYTPKSEWQGIVDQAVAIVQEISDHKVLNRDVRPDSFIIQRNSSGYKVFMIDFGLARSRGLDESDRDWAKAKLMTDEEGAVGLIMKLRLGREDFELQFKSSDRYKEWAGGDDEELSD